MTPPGASRTRRNVAVVTGTRAEYGLLKSVLTAIQRRPKLHLQLVVTGMHLLPRFGRTVRDIEADGYEIAAKVRMQSGSDDPADQALGLGKGVSGMAGFFHDAGTDIVVVLGDRIEALAGALAASALGKFVAHIHGGEVSGGDCDDAYRHAITKLAHVHYAATRASARRIEKLGERPETIHCVGAPGLDRIFELDAENKRKRIPREHAMVIFHPQGRGRSVERRAMETIARALDAADLPAVVIHPNSDRGCTGILDAIESWKKTGGDRIRVHRSLPRDDYLRLLLASRFLIGNSSGGIIEAPAVGIPVVNVGDRQEGRQLGGKSVFHADETDKSVADAIRKALDCGCQRPTTSPYGRGGAGERIARSLETLSLSPTLRRKAITY